jgi:hypothetical protein
VKSYKYLIYAHHLSAFCSIFVGMEVQLMALFIEKRRKEQGMSRKDLARAMGTSARSYNYKLGNTGFNELEIMKASRALKFKIVFIPEEASITSL